MDFLIKIDQFFVVDGVKSMEGNSCNILLLVQERVNLR